MEIVLECTSKENIYEELVLKTNVTVGGAPCQGSFEIFGEYCSDLE